MATQQKLETNRDDTVGAPSFAAHISVLHIRKIAAAKG
jgi:hypothetical protein